jgi:peptidoglycan hydrolase-like protein with peptidoglycan-binding domain
MGPRTAEALRSFQRRQGLPVTGRADESTVTALGVKR